METTEYYERIDSASGNYIIAKSRDFEKLLTKEPVVVGGLTIAVGDKTSLHDWFVAPAEYLGLLDGNKMIFYLGEDNGTLFDEGLHYYDVTYRITENRIGKSYKTGTFRDRFFRDKNGRKFWK